MDHLEAPAELSIWAADLALIALDFVQKSIQILHTGRVHEEGTLTDHPVLEQRRRYMREESLKSLDRIGRPEESARAARLLRISQEIVSEDLWHAAELGLTVMHQRGDRPSPLWRNLYEEHTGRQ